MARLKGAARRAAAVAATTCLLALPAPPARGAKEKEIFGWLERIEVGESRLDLVAKLDTGADTSSLDARRIRRYRHSSRPWVEFIVRSEESGRQIRMRKRVVREARIKEHDGSRQRRPVVNMEVCLGRHLLEVEVSLIDRREFDAPVLLGRNALRDLSVVDPALTYTAEPRCSREEDD